MGVLEELSGINAQDWIEWSRFDGICGKEKEKERWEIAAPWEV